MNTTETLDKLYLEWSQFTNARTERENKAAAALAVFDALAEQYIPDNGWMTIVNGLSLADVRRAAEAYRMLTLQVSP